MAPQQGGTRHSPDEIATRIVDAILAGRLTPGQRLGEQSLADLFGVSRTLVREALARLSARGMVEVNSRRGWFVVQPSAEEAREAFEARVAIETGLVQNLAGPPSRAKLTLLKRHIKAEREAIRAGDAGQRSYLLGDFHVCLAECAGNALLAEILRDLTARTTLIATLFQSTHDATRSCDDHARIVQALETGDIPLATRLVREHIGTVVQHLGTPTPAHDALSQLRSALESPRPADTPVSGSRPRKRLFTELVAPPASPSPQAPSRAIRRRSLEK
jgi:DNA-binding GntR family transcriptional regulator